MAICWERVVPSAFHLCCFNFKCRLGCVCPFPVWCLGRNVELDCIGSWSLPFCLLFTVNPSFFNSSLHSSRLLLEHFILKNKSLFPFEISSEWVIGKLVYRSTWRLFLLNSFLDTSWFQAVMKDCMVDNSFLGALFYPCSSSNTIFFLNK